MRKVFTVLRRICLLLNTDYQMFLGKMWSLIGKFMGESYGVEKIEAGNQWRIRVSDVRTGTAPGGGRRGASGGRAGGFRKP